MVEFGVVDFLHSPVQLLYLCIELYAQCEPFFLLPFLKRIEGMSRTVYFMQVIMLNSFEEEFITFVDHGRRERIHCNISLVRAKHILCLLPLYWAFIRFLKIFLAEVILQGSLTLERCVFPDPLFQEFRIAVGKLPLAALLPLLLWSSHKCASVEHFDGLVCEIVNSKLLRKLSVELIEFLGASDEFECESQLVLLHHLLQ